MPGLRGQRLYHRQDLGADRIDLEGQRQRHVLRDGALQQQHRALGEQAQPVEHLQPALVVLDGVGGGAEQAHRAGVGPGRGGERG